MTKEMNSSDFFRALSEDKNEDSAESEVTERKRKRKESSEELVNTDL